MSRPRAEDIVEMDREFVVDLQTKIQLALHYVRRAGQTMDENKYTLSERVEAERKATTAQDRVDELINTLLS